MRKSTAKRFRTREITTGKRKGGIHVSPASYRSFLGELELLKLYLNTHLLPLDPEEVTIGQIVLNLQNILEYALERVIESFVSDNPTRNNQDFLNHIQKGYVSFKEKFCWAYNKRLLTQQEYDTLEEIRIIRNNQTHSRPSLKRIKLKYFGKPLLSRSGIIRMFTDINDMVLKLRSLSGNRETWRIIPPGFAEEMGWYKGMQGGERTKC